MADLELGNIMFNTNKNQILNCPRWVVALLENINNKLKIVAWNTDHKEFDSPFENTGNRWSNDVFEVQAYSWDDEISQPYNFKCGEIEISWYKYLGRDTTINAEYTEKELIDMYNKCIESLDRLNNSIMEEILNEQC